MKIGQRQEHELSRIKEVATSLESLLENLWKETSGDSVSIQSEPVVIIVTKEGEDIELSLADLSDGKLREAYLKA